jgi:hypothetical protein
MRFIPQLAALRCDEGRCFFGRLAAGMPNPIAGSGL